MHFCNIWPGNRAGLFSNEKNKGVNKKGKYRQEKKASDKGTNTQNIYIVLKSIMFLGCNRVGNHITS